MIDVVLTWLMSGLGILFLWLVGKRHRWCWYLSLFS